MGLTAKKVYAVLNGKIKKLSGDVSDLGTPLFYAGSVTTADLLPVSPKLAQFIISSKNLSTEKPELMWRGTGRFGMHLARLLTLNFLKTK